MAMTPFYLNSSVELLNPGNSPFMSVNGAISSKEYSYSPLNKLIWVSTIELVINDSGTNSLTNFGAISALASGILVESVIDGQAYEIMTIKSNYQILSFFSRMSVSNGASSLTGDQGFGASSNWAKAVLDLGDNKILLSNYDKIRATVRDDLRAIDLLTMSCHITEER